MAVVFRRYLSVSLYSLFAKFILECLQLQWGVIWSVGIWSLEIAKLQAATESSVYLQSREKWNSLSEFRELNASIAKVENFHQKTTSRATNKNSVYLRLHENRNYWNSRSELIEQVTSVANLENLHPAPHSRIEGSSVPLHHPLAPPPLLIAAPENFNPSLRSPPPKPLPKPPPKPLTSTQPLKPIAVLENIQTDFRSDTDNFGQNNQFIEPTAQFRLPNGNRIRLKAGFNSFDDPGFESITNIPIQVGWEGKVDRVTLQTAVGVDLFNRLPTAFNLNAKVEAPISQNVDSSGQLLSGVVLSGALENGSYKFNAQTLDNHITTWRFGPDLYWQIDRNTSLFLSFRLGNYSDGNYEQQLFSRLERKLGQFSLAANLFNWSYARDLESKSGYFSPPDFLLYNVELAWEGDVFDFLRCRLATSLGRQRLEGEIDNANGYQARCTAKLSPNIEADLGYSFSNVRNQDTDNSAYNARSLTGQLRVKF
jgi:hypothetical protein